jgi:uroporphyrinogen decarboxylase
LALPTGPVHLTQFLRGFIDWFVDLGSDQRLFTSLMEATAEVQLAIVSKALDEVGDLVDIIACSDDLGHQNGPLCSPETYRKVIRPFHEKMFGLMHSKSSAKILFHSCGSVEPLVEDLIDTGVDLLNPIQVRARNMGSRYLKGKYGGRIGFWGAIDTQEVLPRGTPAEVREEVAKRISDLAPGGGYVVSAVHNIQPDVSPENICALFDAVEETGGHPGRE